jgi:hypothetical protein
MIALLSLGALGFAAVAAWSGWLAWTLSQTPVRVRPAVRGPATHDCRKRCGAESR